MSSSNLNINDFSLFFRAIQKRDPFPWQIELIRKLCEDGEWPQVLSLPTGTGKTCVIDIAVFHLAMQRQNQDVPRTAPLRIFFVVDRRLVVDEAYQRAENIKKYLDHALKDAPVAEDEKILHKVSQALKTSYCKSPLEVIRLRGGMPGEKIFVRNPSQPLICVSTVDQIGSRLLFRGYGVSNYARPIHAGLIAEDSLIIIDEAHLSQPFSETLKWVNHYRSAIWAEKPLSTPFSIVQMTATPNSEGRTFTLSEADYSNEILKRRLESAKFAELQEIKTAGEDKQPDLNVLAKNCVNGAQNKLKRLLERGIGQPVVGVVVNRIATARFIYEKLKQNTIQDDGYDVLLLIGRMRPIERRKLLDQSIEGNFLTRMKAGRSPGSNPRPLFVVATQTVEVGADLDFDALVTEAASLDALRQRFGRLNRLGNYDTAEAVIIFDKSAPKKDPIYGESIANTWKWLNEISTKKKVDKKTIKFVNFGLKSLSLPEASRLRELEMPSVHAPVLMPAHIDLLVQTSPSPFSDPEINVYLHGPQTQLADVQIIWRADLPQEFKDTQDFASEVIDLISVVPPSSLEAVSIPVGAVKTWLRGIQSEDPLTDLEGVEAGVEGRSSKQGRFVLRWAGIEESEIIRPERIQPGDILVVPASYGGLDDQGCWNPESEKTVFDVAEEATLLNRNKYVLRVHSSVINQWWLNNPNKELLHILDIFLSKDEMQKEDLDELLDTFIKQEGIPSHIEKILAGLKKGFKFYFHMPDNKGKVEEIIFYQNKKTKGEFNDEDDSSSSFTREVELASHCEGVSALARDFAQDCNLPASLVEDLALAGKFHDLGKADPRFQIMLHGGSRTKARNYEKLLAKSQEIIASKSIFQRIRELARYPKGARHECYSVVLAKHNELLVSANDPDLVLYLLGTHHGRGRPFMPPIQDPGTKINFMFGGQQLSFAGEHNLEKLNSGWADLFWKLVRRYGYWGVSYLETILRLADHRRSEMEMGDND